MKLYIDDIVKIGRFDALGPLQGVKAKIVSLVKPIEPGATYQVCNLRRVYADGTLGERLPNVDSRVLVRDE